MADGNYPHLRLIDRPSARIAAFPAPSFRHSSGEVYLRTARLAPDAVEALLALFQREAGRTGDWTLHDQLQAARDGLEPEPPQAA